MKEFSRLFLSAMVFAGFLLTTFTSNATVRDCYHVSQDADSDGFAREGATAKKLTVLHSQKLNCPNGYVKLAGDRYDDNVPGNRDIHPRSAEVAYDGVDNDSDGRTDDPGFVYPMNNRANWVTSSSFKVKLKINDRVITEARARGQRVGAVVTLTNLKQSQTSLPPITLNYIDWETSGSRLYATLTVPNLDPITVYKAIVQFADVGSSTELGAETDEYFTTTTGPGTEDKRRTGILLRGFHELNESKEGRVGYLGKPYEDGAKYGSRPTEAWCSEFYNWATTPYIKGIKNETSVPQMVRFFEYRHSYRSKDDIAASAATEDFRGDYLPQFEGTTKILGHSSMFLAYDADADKVWTLEGNVGDGVGVRHRGFDKLSGHGHFEYKKLDCEEWCAANAECSKCDTNRACGVGYERLESWTGPGTNWHACAEKARSRNNHNACLSWCNANDNCKKCDTNRACGVGYERLKSWTGSGTNWHACAEKARSRGHHAACEAWCREHEECAKCSTIKTCGPGYTRLQSWTGRGTNWHACAEEGITIDNHALCQEWCDARDDCIKCDTSSGCGVGFEGIKSWTGRGTNWHACAEKSRSRENHAACELWCRDHRECTKCSTKVGCGSGYARLKSWTGKGTNWHACRKSTSRDNKVECEAWCNTRTDCVKCDTNSACGVGFERLESWTGPGSNWHACAEKARSKGNHDACMAWCNANDNCRKCDTNRACGVGYERLKSWTGSGTNWHACAEKQRSQDNHAACAAYCEQNPDCVKCSTKYGCGRGYKRMDSWTGRGTNWHACKKR